MSTYQFRLRIDAPPDLVFDLWTDLDRMGEWIGGVTKVTDVSGPAGEAGTTYTTWFGNVSSRTEVLEAERPKMIRTRFGSWLLRGESKATFEPEGDGTRLTQEYRVQGLIPRVMARIFATGSYRGSFRGELNDFARLAERDARARKG
jgi:uncharacterized protein YndB with AHSA1/START domain